METRAIKQVVIGIIFFLIVGSIGYGIIDYFFVIEPTCFDKIQNGQEEGVDCGTLACGVACEPSVVPLNILSQKLIEVRAGDYDFVAQINNPNSIYGTSRAVYELTFGGEVKRGTFFILPGQTRYIIIPSISSDSPNVSFEVTEVEWTKVEAFENVSFPIRRKNYRVIKQNGTFSELEAVIFNNSDFDFDKVEVGVILFDNSNNIIAANRTDIRTLVSRTERYFKVSWPVELPESARQDVEVITNVFENANFIKRYGTQEKFQKYY